MLSPGSPPGESQNPNVAWGLRAQTYGIIVAVDTAEEAEPKSHSWEGAELEEKCNVSHWVVSFSL